MDPAQLDAKMGDKAKKTFDFRMSKKVAELTQVVHMLFTRNHEKEVEIELLKEAYEYEIQVVQEDAYAKITRLEDRNADLQKQLEMEKRASKERVKSAVQQETEGKDSEWRKRLEIAEKLLEEEKAETQNLRDLLINAQQDLEKLRQGVAEQLRLKNEEIQQRDKELDRLRKMVQELETTNQESEKHYKELLKDLEKSNQKLEKEIKQLQEMLEATHRMKVQLESKTQKLEIDLKNLRRDFNRKVSEVVASQKNIQDRLPRSAGTHYTSEKNTNNNKPPKDYNEELEKLRREVQRYRLELSNRDNNFNRMFTDKTLSVDHRAGKIALDTSPLTHGGKDPNVSRQNSFSYAFMQSLDESGTNTGTSTPVSATKRPNSRVLSASAAARQSLPVLTPEQKHRLTQLMKPRPLPKEMLYGK